MADNPAALSSPPARAGMTAWMNGVDDMDERSAAAGSPGPLPWVGAGQAGHGRARCHGAPSSRGSLESVTEVDRGGAGRRRSGAGLGRGEGGQGAPAPGAAGVPRIRWPVAGRGRDGRRAGAVFTGRVGDGAAWGGRGRGGAGRVGRAWGEHGGGGRRRARGELAAANGGGRGGVRA
ncbi:uncharacterized protein [Miscanthus floridulus]|uniref:uncharacterized protein n=1 Tax=Miscanthus floridulus TaxID=154761 RepID=UPI00345A5D6B